MVSYNRCWGEDRVYFHDEQGRLIGLPAAWTDVAPPDPFVVVAAGRSYFRAEDLGELTRLVRRLSSGSRRHV
jgi:hypothetical protein